MSNKVEWSAGVTYDFDGVHLYNTAAWMFGDFPDETNTLKIAVDLSMFQADFAHGIVEPLHTAVEKILNDNGFERVDDWHGTFTHVMKK